MPSHAEAFAGGDIGGPQQPGTRISEHPLHRIMQVEEQNGATVIRTTDIHLPRRIGEALEHGRPVWQGARRPYGRHAGQARRGAGAGKGLYP